MGRFLCFLLTAFLFLAPVLPSYAQASLQGTVKTSGGYPVDGARVLFYHSDGGHADSVMTDSSGYYLIQNLYTGMTENASNSKTSLQVHPSPGARHQFQMDYVPGAEELMVYDMQGRCIARLPVNVNNETATAVWEARGVSGGVYLASYARQAIRVLHRRGGAQPLPHTSRPKTQSAGALRDQYNVEVRALSDTTNVMFPGVSQQKVISGGMNSLNVTVNPTSYRHSYRLVSQTGGVQVTLTGAGHTFFDDTLNSSGLAFTDTLYAGASEQLQLQAQAPGKVSLDTSFSRHFTEDTIPILLQDSVYQFILTGDSPDSVSYEFWNKNETTPLASGWAHNGYKDTVKTSQTLDSMLVKMQKQGRVDKDTTIGVAQGANTFNMPELDLEYVIKASGSANNASVKLVYEGDTLTAGTLDTTQTPNWQSTIVRTPQQAMDTIQIVQDKQGRARTTSEHEIKTGQNSIQLPGMNYENSQVYGGVLRKKSSGSNNVINHAFVKIKGLNVNHEDTITMDGQSYFDFTNIPIPADPQGNADTAMYELHLSPTDTSSTQMFKEYVDTIKITQNTFSLGQVYVNQLDQNQSIKGTITDIYDSTKTLDSTMVIFRKQADSTIIAQDVTGPNGEYNLNNIPCQTQGFFQVGYKTTNAGYLSREGHEYQTQTEIVWPKDSSATVNWTMVPDSLELPTTTNDPNHGTKVTANPNKIKDMIRGPPSSAGYLTDAEEASRRQVLLNYGSMTQTDKQLFKSFVILPGDSLFYGISKDVPINDPSRPFKLVNYYLDAGSYSSYHPDKNYHPDSLGWNVSAGANTTVFDALDGFNNNKQYSEISTNGGDISVDLTDQAGNIKEIYGRSEHRNDVGMYPSFMNLNASMPTLQDRAIIYLLHENEKKRLGENSTDYYPLDKVTHTITQNL